MKSARDVKGIGHRPLFWISIVLLLVPTIWLAIDLYAMWGLEPASPSLLDNGRMAFIVFSFATSYAPGLMCLFLAIFVRRKAQSKIASSI